MRRRAIALFVLALCGCGGGEEGGTLRVAWAFSEGDCASNGVETVSIGWTLMGADPKDAEFACSQGTADLEPIPEGGASYSFTAQGLDADGVVRAESFGQSTTLSASADFPPIDITLHPKSVNVTVSWTVPGVAGTRTNCPGSVVLPFHIALYEPGSGGEELGAKVTEQQESCSAGSTTLERVAPGDYIVEVDSRAVTPAVRGTTMITVEPGDDLEVSLDL